MPPAVFPPPTGTWTPLVTQASAQTQAGNVPSLLQSPTGDFSTPPPEVSAIVQMVATGYGINFWPACVLLRSWLTGLINKGAPTP